MPAFEINVGTDNRTVTLRTQYLCCPDDCALHPEGVPDADEETPDA